MNKNRHEGQAIVFVERTNKPSIDTYYIEVRKSRPLANCVLTEKYPLGTGPSDAGIWTRKNRMEAVA